MEKKFKEQIKSIIVKKWPWCEGVTNINMGSSESYGVNPESWGLKGATTDSEFW